MRKHLYVDNVDLATYGVYISGGGTFSAPAKAYNWYSPPNRNGDILGVNKRLENIQVSYDCFIFTNFDANIAALRSFLLSRNGLVRIADDYHTGEFRKGVYAGPFEPTITQKLDAGKFTLTFVCLPQRWLTSGETATTYNFLSVPFTYETMISIPNTTNFAAKPLLRVYGYGHFFCGQNVKITNHGQSYVDIDCETMACYCGNTNLSEYVSFGQSGVSDPPTIPAGGTTLGKVVTDYSNLVSITITPRYWEV